MADPRFPRLRKVTEGVDRFMGRMAGPPSPFLSPQEQAAMQQRQKMAMTAALLQGAGPVPRGTSSPLQAFGGAMTAGMQSGDQFTADAMRARMLASQMQGGATGTASLQEYDRAVSQGYKGTYTDYKKEFEGREAALPSNVAEWNFYNSLPEEQKDKYLDLKRASAVVDIGKVPTLRKPSGEMVPLSTPEAESEGARRQAAAGAAGAAAGAAQGALPQAEQTAQTALETIDNLRNHPGRVIGTGASRLGQMQNVPGTPAYDFEVALKQAKGQVFLNAYQGLKGSGNITEVEGQKAEQAIARMDASQSEGAFLDALDDLELVIRRGVETARKRAGAPAPQDGGSDFSNMSDEELKRLAEGGE